VIWTRNSPNWHFDAATLDGAAVAFDNPDYVEVVLHSYRHRLGFAPSYPPYDQLEQLAAQPPITVPAVTLDGLADGNFPATDGSTSARHFTGPACTTRYRTPVTTCPRRPRTPSPARSWNWQRFDHDPPEGDAPDPGQ
jgi:hypothetical protein